MGIGDIIRRFRPKPKPKPKPKPPVKDTIRDAIEGINRPGGTVGSNPRPIGKPSRGGGGGGSSGGGSSGGGSNQTSPQIEDTIQDAQQGINRTNLPSVEEVNRNRFLAGGTRQDNIPRVDAPIQQQQEEIERPPSVVSEAPRETGLRGVSQRLRETQSQFETEGLRGNGNFIDGALNFGAGVLDSTVVSPLIAITNPVETGKGIASFGKDAVTGNLDLSDIGTKAKTNPLGLAGNIVGDVLLFKGSSKLINFGTKASDFTRVAASPKGKFPTTLTTGEKFVQGIDDVGDLGLIPGGKGLGKGAFDQATVRGGFGFSTAEQARFIGKTGPVSSTQSGFLGGNPFKKTSIVGPGDSGLGLFGTPSQLIDDIPTAQTRVSRIGTVKEATFSDIISGDFTFKRPKPEFLVFKDQTIGKKGNFKPFGFAGSSELEVTLPPGTKVKRTGTPGTTFVDGKRVPIRTVDVVGKIDDIDTGFKPKPKKPGKSGGSSKPTTTRFVSPAAISTPFLPTPVSSGLSLQGSSKGISGLSPSKSTQSPFSPIGSSNPFRGFSPLSSPRTFSPLPRGFSGLSSPGTFKGFPGFGKLDFNPLGAPQFSRVKPGKRKFRRNPTLLAAELGIFDTKPFRFEETGLGTRPILRKRKKLRKRRG